MNLIAENWLIFLGLGVFVISRLAGFGRSGVSGDSGTGWNDGCDGDGGGD